LGYNLRGEGPYYLQNETHKAFTNYPNLCMMFYNNRKCQISGSTPEFTYEVESNPAWAGKKTISNLTELQAMNDDLTGDYVLIADIDAAETENWNGGEGFVPIGSSGNEFKGTFDGGYHTISNLHINRTTLGYNFGLFGHLGDATNPNEAAHIQNLKLIDCDYDGRGGGGLLVGTIGNGSTVTDCYATGSMVCTIGHDLGGLVGTINNDAVFTRCGCVVSLIQPWESGNDTGGFYGLNTGTGVTFTDCYARANITRPGGACKMGVNQGGFGGYESESSDGGTLINCYSAGSIQYQNSCFEYSYDTRPVAYTGGGFFGRAESPTLTSCYWDKEEGASVYPDSAKFITGYANDRQRAYLNQNMTGGHYHVTHDGKTTGEISYSANSATVQAALDATFGADEIIHLFDGSDVWDTNSHFKIMFHGPAYGYSPQADITFDMSAITPGGTTATIAQLVNGVAPASFAGIDGRTTAQMKTQSNYTDWDFDSVWTMNTASGYPELQFQSWSASADMNPADIIEDLITNDRYGLGQPAIIHAAGLAKVRAYCYANDILISIKIDDRKPVIDWIDHILTHCNGYRFWSGGLLKLGVYQDEDPVEPHITQDHLVVDKDSKAPPVNIKPRERSETYNRVELGWTNRDNKYDYSVEPAYDQVDQRTSADQGLPAVRTREVDLDGITRQSLAATIAWRMLYEGLYRHNVYTFRVGYKQMLLEVGDVKLLSDGGRLVEKKIRIVQITEQQFGRVLKVEAVDEGAEMYPSIDYSSQIQLTPKDNINADLISLADSASVNITPLKISVADAVGVTDDKTVSVV
jgi:hypothetical protein